MKKLLFSILPMLYILLYTGCTTDDSQKVINFRPHWDTERVLENPNKGWYHHELDNQILKYKVTSKEMFWNFPGMDHLYLRFAWSFLEPKEGEYDWTLIDEIVNEFVPRGYGIAFSITSKETGWAPIIVGQEKNGVQYATPVWVEEAGCKGYVTEAEYAWSWSPVWDDPVYLEKLDNFHRAFAERYDGQPWVRYVDVASIGEWGEGHTSFSTMIPPTVKEVKANMDIYLKHYKNTLLVATDDLIYYGKPEVEAKELYEYAIKNGMTIRDDSPMVDYYIERYQEFGSVSHPGYYDPLYKTKPTILEMQHYSMVKDAKNWIGLNGSGIIPEYGQSGAEILLKAIETMHATYIGFHGFVEDWLVENPDLTKQLANKCGYWYFPVTASFEKEILTGQNQLSISWMNEGVAPAYEPFNLLLKFRNTQGQETVLNLGDSKNRQWLPGKEYEQTYTYTLPAEFLKGNYTLSFRLDHQNRPIEVGVKTTQMDDDKFISLGTITIK